MGNQLAGSIAEQITDKTTSAKNFLAALAPVLPAQSQLAGEQ